MKSIKAVEGITRVIDRKDIFSEVYDMYYTGDISECPIFIKFLKEDGVDMVASNETCFRDFGRKHMPSFLKAQISLFLWLILLDAFLEYISNQERHLIKEVILLGTAGKFPDHVQEKMLNILSRFGCRQIPAPASLVACIEDIAKYEFITKPAVAIFSVHSGIPKSHKDFWNKQSISSISIIYNDLTVTPEKILNLPVQSKFMLKNEEGV